MASAQRVLPFLLSNTKASFPRGLSRVGTTKQPLVLEDYILLFFTPRCFTFEMILSRFRSTCFSHQLNAGS